MLSIEDYRALFSSAPDGYLVVDHEGIIRTLNPKVEAMFGWRREDLVGQGIEVLVPEATRDVHRTHRVRYQQNPHHRPMGLGLDLRGRRRDGTTFPVEIGLSPWDRGELGTSIICAIRDVTEYRRLQDFSEGALRASEEERRRIARELHDDTAQRLATLILRVRALAERPDRDGRMELFQQIKGELVEAVNGVKRISRGLLPPELEEVGLGLALQAHARGLREGAGFEVDVEVEAVDPFLDQTKKLILYRVIQEALSNALRHSGCDHAAVEVRLDREAGRVVAVIRDEGKGFSLAEAEEGDRGLGLLGMRERAAMVEGRLEVQSVPRKGTTVTIWVPIGAEAGDG